MQSDTLIGIAGAIVLVAVMVGVFAYEYNNTPADVDDDGTVSMDGFNETYPFLEATDDIDGDGVANWEDDDLDDDGTPNAEDDVVEVTIDASGTAPAYSNPAGAAPSDSTPFEVFAGNSHIHIAIEYDPGDAPLNVNRLSAQVSGDDDVGSCTDPDGDGTCEIVQQAAVLAGEYVLNVSQTQPNPAGLSYTATITITYS